MDIIHESNLLILFQMAETKGAFLKKKLAIVFYEHDILVRKHGVRYLVYHK